MKIQIFLLSVTILFLSTSIPSIIATSEQDKLWELDSPVLQENSTKGEFTIQLKSSLANTLKNFPIEVVFLNGTLPEHTVESIPTMESNNTGDRMETSGLTVPSVLERTSPIQNFNIIIYDSKGNEIWKKTNQSSLDGRAFYDVDFGKYIGNFTILINNIVPENNKIADVSDSVKFTSNIGQK